MEYLILSSVCLSLFYITYRLISGKGTNFHQLRIYLLGSIILSLLLPLICQRFELPGSAKTTPVVINTGTLMPADIPSNNPANTYNITPADPILLYAAGWKEIIIKLYLLTTAFFILRILKQLVFLFIQYKKAEKIWEPDCILLYNHSFKSTFSFFRLVFVQPASSHEDIKQIIAHEKIHVYQHHSLDLIVIELLAAAMWFNPLIWMMKNSLQLVHEYLADEGVLDTGVDRLSYQSLLINQAAEEKLVCLSSSFNQSLIKKRIIMMTKNKFNQKSKTRLFTLIPVSVSLFFLVSALSGLFPEKAKATDNTEIISLQEGSSRQEFVTDKVTGKDTIKKTEITKVYVTEDSQDTIIEKEIRIVSNDNHPEGTIRHHSDALETRDAESKTVRHVVHSRDSLDARGTRSHMEFRTGQKQRHLVTCDTVVTREIVTNEDGDKNITIQKTIEIRNHNGDPGRSKILYIIDGTPAAVKDPISTLNPDDILKIEVIKNSEIKKYTSENYDGVILITTKKGKN